MTKRFLCLVAATIFSTSFAYADAPATQPHALPADGTTPVITLDRKGGRILHRNPEPVFQILADGTAIVGNPYGFSRVVKGTLSQQELQDLLHFILDEEKFADITPADLKPQGMVMIGDAQNTTISIDADGAPHACGGVAVEMVAKQAGPDSPAGRFDLVQKKIDHVRRVIIVGGEVGLKKYLDLANAKLKADLANEPPMQGDDLAIARPSADGSTEIIFQHKAVVADGKWHLIDAVVSDDGKGNVTVKVQKGADQPG